MISFKNSLYASLLLLGLGMLPVSAMNIKPAISDQEIAVFNKMLKTAIKEESLQNTQNVIYDAIEAGATSDQILKILTDRDDQDDDDQDWVALKESTPEITRFLLEIALKHLSRNQIVQFIAASDSQNYNALFYTDSDEKTKSILDVAVRYSNNDQFYSFINLIDADGDTPLAREVFNRIGEGLDSESDREFVSFFNMLIEAALARLNAQQFKDLFFVIGTGGSNILGFAAGQDANQNTTVVFETIINEAAICLDPKDFDDFINAQDDEGNSAWSYAKNQENQRLMKILNKAYAFNKSPERKTRALTKKRNILISKIEKANEELAARPARIKENSDRISKNNARPPKVFSETSRLYLAEGRKNFKIFESGNQVTNITSILSALAPNAIQ